MFSFCANLILLVAIYKTFLYTRCYVWQIATSEDDLVNTFYPKCPSNKAMLILLH